MSHDDLLIDGPLIVDETELEKMSRSATILTKRMCPADWQEILLYLGLKEDDCDGLNNET